MERALNERATTFRTECTKGLIHTSCNTVCVGRYFLDFVVMVIPPGEDLCLLASSVKLSWKLISLGSVCIWRFKGRNNNLRYADDTTLMSESKEELKRLLMRMKEESEKASLKLSIQKTNVMASGPITSRQIEGGKVEAVTDFIFFGSKMTVDSDCSHGIKTWEGKLFLRHTSTLEELNSTYPFTST